MEMNKANWSKGRLSDIANIVMGQSPPGEFCNNDRIGIPLLNGPTEFGNFHPIPVQYTTDARKYSQIGDILFCVRGSTTGRMNYSDQIYAIGRGIATIRHKAGRSYQPYVKAVLECNLPILLGSCTGSTFPNISQELLYNLEIYVPPLETQKEIAHILGTFDDKIELNRKMNKTLEEIAQTLFKHWFIDFEFPNAEGKPYKSSGGEMIDSELGSIPKGWRVGKTKDIITAIGGFAFKSENMTDTGEIGVIKIKNIEKGLVNVNNVEYLSDIGEKDIDKKHVIETGDVLIAMTGANVAKVGIVPFTRKRVVLNQRVCLIREKMKNSLYYAYIVFSSNEVQQLLFSVGSAGSAQPNISTSDIESVEIILPPFETISQFGEISYGIFLVVCKNIFQNEIIANQRTDIIKSLM